MGTFCDMQTLWLTVCANKRWKMKASMVSEKKKRGGWPQGIYFLHNNVTREII